GSQRSGTMTVGLGYITTKIHEDSDSTITVSGRTSFSGIEYSTSIHFHKNHRPQLTGLSPLGIPEDSMMTMLILATDRDGDPVSIQTPSLPSWLRYDPATASISGTPRGADVGDTVVALQAVDSWGALAEMSLSIRVAHVNHVPRLLELPLPLAAEDSVYTSRVVANDQDSARFGDRLVYRLEANPYWMSVDSTTGMIRGKPSARDVGEYSVTARVDDGRGGCVTDRFRVSVRHTNHNPMITSVPDSHVSEDSSYRYHVAAVDSDSDLFGDTLRYHLIAGPEWLSMDSSNGLLSGTPAAGDVGAWNVKILVDDGKGGSVTQDFALSVLHVNHSPRFLSAILKDLVAVEDSVFSATFGALDTDVPTFRDTLRYQAIILPHWLTLDPLTGQVTGSPREGDRDTVLSISVTDGYFGDTLTVTLSVAPVNDPPALSTMPSWEVDEFDSLTVSFASLSPYVQDPDDPDSLMHWAVNGTRDLYVCTTPEGIRIIPQNGWAGIDSVRLIVRDSGELADTTDVRVAVRPVDHPPTITSAPDTVAYADLPYRWEIMVHDIHPADSTFKYHLVGPSWLSIGPGGSLEGRPRTIGRVTVSVRVSDRAGFSDSVRFQIAVRSNDELKEIAGAVPTTFVLKPNYPNPFNPVTTIRFGVPEKSRVTLRVFNVIGQLVDQLADDERDPGYYEVRWAPRTQASGAYFLLMEAQSSTNPGYSYRSTQRMLLLK
ncbi:MAG: putative Ig domain-containing protein, partial [Bacteroidota bacterium]